MSNLRRKVLVRLLYESRLDPPKVIVTDPPKRRKFRLWWLLLLVLVYPFQSKAPDVEISVERNWAFHLQSAKYALPRCDLPLWFNLAPSPKQLPVWLLPIITVPSLLVTIRPRTEHYGHYFNRDARRRSWRLYRARV